MGRAVKCHTRGNHGTVDVPSIMMALAIPMDGDPPATQRLADITPPAPANTEHGGVQQQEQGRRAGKTTGQPRSGEETSETLLAELRIALTAQDDATQKVLNHANAAVRSSKATQDILANFKASYQPPTPTRARIVITQTSRV